MGVVGADLIESNSDGAISTPWAQRIRASWQKSVEGILETGRLLIEAKAALPHGSFLKMVGEELPFSSQTAQKLMAVAADPRLSNTAHVRFLPPSWGTLYELTKLDDGEWALAEQRGLIRADVQRSEIAGLLRDERHAELARRPIAPLPDGVFDVICADPPWRYDFAETGNRKIENQYPTLTPEEIAAIRPQAAEDSALFLWATAPKLEEALFVLERWGFSYVTNAVWDKGKIGMGYWFRGRHELLLVGKRGSFSPPPPKARADSVLCYRRGRHSEKPDGVYRLMERMFPHAKRLDMFARCKRKGWTPWGNECPTP